VELDAKLIAELNARREELKDLKRCQLQYFVLSVGGTGILVGLLQALSGPMFVLGPVPQISRQTVDQGLASLYFLAPLAIVLPCWLVFFDKATTITRIAGYCRWIEGQLGHQGNERALGKFRKREDEDRKASPKWKLVLEDVLFLRVRHRYWFINWCTFAALSGLCLLMAFAQGGTLGISRDPRLVGVTVATLLTGYCAFYTACVLWSLVWGPYSYSHVAAYWDKVLASDVVASIQDVTAKEMDSEIGGREATVAVVPDPSQPAV
jgi:hypothetical protein